MSQQPIPAPPMPPPRPDMGTADSWSSGPGTGDRAPWSWVAIIAGGILVAAAVIAIVAAVVGHVSKVSRSHAQVTAQDRVAEADLRNAIAVAKVYFTNGDTYRGFDPSVAATIEPSLSWVGNAPAVPGIVSINLAQDGEILMTTMSGSGRVFCIADDESQEVVITFGRLDGYVLPAASDCTGGW